VTTRRKTGSVFALGGRFVRLGTNGAPLVGPDNAYVTDNLVRLDFTMLYRDGDTKERTNGTGRACLYYEAPTTVKGLTINALELCYPDPELEEFLQGGDVLVDADSDPVGYAAPEVGAEAGGIGGIGVELWSSAVHDDGVDDDDPYMRWLYPRLKVRETGTRSVGPDPMAISYEGTGRQNPNYGRGPFSDWPYTSSRVFQQYRTATIPDLSVNGLVPVAAPVAP
jgi:hypothetical protein